MTEITEAMIEAAWQAFGDSPIYMCGDHDEEQRKCVVAAISAALALSAGQAQQSVKALDAISIIEARLPLYTDIGQINALRECISSIRSALVQPAVPGEVETESLQSYFERQINWSRETFGPSLRTKGVIEHIRKELREIEQEPHDLSEWIDVVILAMDGFWRHGGNAADLLPALLAKQVKNMARVWPDWRTRSEDQAIEHDRSHDVPLPEIEGRDKGEPHTDDIAVDRFAAAMKAKLAEKRAQGYHGWDDPEDCTIEHLRNLLVKHVGKGDPVDVGNFAMMIHQRGGRISTPETDVILCEAEPAAWEDEFGELFSAGCNPYVNPSTLYRAISPLPLVGQKEGEGGDKRDGWKWVFVPDYPEGNVVGPCICGSWPGGPCLKCPGETKP